MLYNIRHITRYRYSAPIRESIMEARMQPRSDGNQRCLEFRLEVAPRARPSCYQDHLENTVHHFDIPGEHQELFLLAESTVDVKPIIELPTSLPHAAWREIDQSEENDVSRIAQAVAQGAAVAFGDVAAYIFAQQL